MTRLRCRGRTTNRSELLLTAGFFSLHCAFEPVDGLDMDEEPELPELPVAEADGAEPWVALGPDVLPEPVPAETAVPEGNATLETSGVTSSWVEARLEMGGPGNT